MGVSADVQALCVSPQRSIRACIATIDATRRGIVLIVDEAQRLLGTVTDGDVRRAILAGTDLQQPIHRLLEQKAGTRYERPITAPAGADRSVYIALLKQHNILHLPIVDEARRIVGLVTSDELLVDGALPVQAVVMAGGIGSRMYPLTEQVPKPMLEVGGRPLLEIIIQQLREAGITEVKVTTHHKPEKITGHFGDGSGFGVRLSYIEEERPLGTAGGLALLGPLQETTLVMNGDILTQVDFRAMLAYHREHQADLTIAVRQYDVKVPYGVIHCDGPVVRGVSEKPVMDFFVNAGIYFLEPAVQQFMPSSQRFDMTDLIQSLLKQGRSVISFPIREYWLDIGQHSDYEQAQEQVKQWGVAA